MSIEQRHVGARSELFACVWLLDNGYEVYRNVSPHGGVDIIATKDGNFFLFDVKTRRFGKDGKLVQGIRLKPEQIAKGVKPLYVCDDGTCVSEDNPEAAPPPKKCLQCRQTFQPAKTDQRFCSLSCRARNYRENMKLQEIRLG